jgi:opacity protein-like surface antigen
VIRAMVCATFLAGVIVTSAVPAQAQVMGQFLGGVTSTSSEDLVLGGALGVAAGPVEITFEGGYMRDVLPKGLLNAFNQLQDERNLPVRARARLSNTYGTVSLKLIPKSGTIRPFVAVGGGVAHMTPKFDVSVLGISLGDVFGATSFESSNKLLLTAGGGVRFDLGSKSLIDLGYRYVRIDSDYAGFNISGVSANVNMLYVALGARF